MHSQSKTYVPFVFLCSISVIFCVLRNITCIKNLNRHAPAPELAMIKLSFKFVCTCVVLHDKLPRDRERWAADLLISGWRDIA